MTNRPRSRPGRWGWRLFLTLFTIYSMGGFYFGFRFFTEINAALVSAATLTSDANEPPTFAAPTPRPTPRVFGADSAPAGPSSASAPQPTPAPAPAVDEDMLRRRVNILLMGLDQREDTADWDPGRTDTMILATIDTKAKTATLLSIPRDLWVAIPSRRYGMISEKITGAHTYGGLEGYPTGDNPLGGPELAKKTVELNFGVPVHYWARVDLKGFEQAVDRVGGVWLDVEQPILDTEYPTDDYGTMTIYIPAGRQLMDGRTALEFARSRHSGNDLERGARQRQVLVALRQQAISLDLIPQLPDLMSIFQDHFLTNMSVTDMARLATLARTIPPENVHSRAIDGRYITVYRTPEGADALLPNRAAIADLVKEVFYTDPLVQAESVRVAVRNGAGKEGFAAAWARSLRDQYSMDVVSVDSADRTDYGETIILDHTPGKNKRYTLSRLQVALGNLPVSRIHSDPQRNPEADIEIILGADAPAR